MMIRLLLVDDDAPVRQGLRMMLESDAEFEIVGEAADGEEALAMVDKFDPDIVLMDIQMPVMDGIEATRRICERSTGAEHGPRVLALTTFERDDYVAQAMQAGATDFLLKRMPADELIARIKDAALPSSSVSPSMS